MSFNDIIKKKQKDWDCPTLMDMDKLEGSEKIPFSSPLLNWCTYGGIPRNKIVEFFGDFGSGKSTTAQDICKNAVKIFEEEYDNMVSEYNQGTISKSLSDEYEVLIENGPKKVCYVDLEHTFDVKWANTIGLDCDKINVMQPPDVVAEEVLQTILELIETGEVGLIILDSIPSLVPRTVFEKKVGERTVAALAGLLTTFSTKVIPLLTRYNCTLLVINQIRDNLDNAYVVNTPGGKALKFYAALRMQFRLGKPVDFLGNELPTNAENPAGYLINTQIVKQKTAPFDRKKGTYYLMCQTGIRPDFDYTTLAIKSYGIIKKGGAWFTMCDPFTGEVLVDSVTDKPVKLNGLGKVYEYLQGHEEYYSKLQKFICDDIDSRSDVGELDG